MIAGSDEAPERASRGQPLAGGLVEFLNLGSTAIFRFIGSGVTRRIPPGMMGLWEPFGSLLSSHGR